MLAAAWGGHLWRRVMARTAPRAASGCLLMARTADHSPCRRALPRDTSLAPAAREGRCVGGGAEGRGSWTGASWPWFWLTHTRLLMAARLGRGRRDGNSRNLVLKGGRALDTPATGPYPRPPPSASMLHAHGVFAGTSPSPTMGGARGVKEEEARTN